jgi:hypothetical protein
MEPEAFEYDLNTAYEFIYNNEAELEPLQYPLAISRYTIPRFANDLYTDNINQYFTYSGTSNSLIVTKEKDGRYKNLTLRAYSGDSFNFYFQAGSGISDSELYYSGPLTTSGVYSTLTQYTTQSGALANAITFTAPANNSSVYTLPTVQNLNWIRLYHGSTDGITPYRIYQFLPRTLIQVDDLEADVIDAVTIRVSGSIVVTADSFADGSITGEKIMAGTVSGVLITPGTVTANEIAGGTITANKLNVAQLSAITSNMGELFVTEKLEVTSGYLTAGIARIDNTGIKIGSSNTGLSASDALRIYGSGTAGNIVGMAFYNGSYSADNPQITIQADSTNALEIDNNAVNGVTNLNFPASGLANSAAVNIYNANLNLRKSPNPPANINPGSVHGYDSDDTLRYYLGVDGVILNNNASNTFSVTTSTGNVTTSGTINAGGSIDTKANISASGTLNVNGLVTTLDNIDVGGSLTTTFQTRVNTDLYVGYNSGTGTYRFNAGTNGDITTVGGIFAGTLNNKFTVASATGNTAIAGTLAVTNKFTASNLAYGTFTRTADLAITTAGTTVTWQSSPRNNNITFSTTDITVGNTGYYLITGYFATVGNVSLRMTLQRTSANYISIQQVTPLSTGGGYIFNFSNAVYLTANTVLKVVLTPSANTTLNQNGETGAAPSPFLHIVQLAGI